jgi:hypothetical protein
MSGFRRAAAVLLAALVLGLGLWLLLRRGPALSAPPAAGPARPADARPPAAPVAPASPAPLPLSGESPIATELNSPAGDIRRDLRVLNEVLETWQTNFPRTGNPVGENVEITRALTGENPLRFAFIRPGHPAINARGELCDRWGTPFRFHALDGRQMEIRSAGPDRRFNTPDDAAFTPEVAVIR